MQVALHTGDLHEHALVRELEQALGRNPSALGQAPAVDLERCLVDELIGVVDADRTQPPDIGVGDASQILEGPVHMYRILVGGSPHPAARFARSLPPHRWGGYVSHIICRTPPPLE